MPRRNPPRIRLRCLSTALRRAVWAFVWLCGVAGCVRVDGGADSGLRYGAPSRVFGATEAGEHINEQGAAERGTAVARPAPPEATLSTRARFSVRSLGLMRTNGQMLPLFSPDGSFAAVQVGAVVPWEIVTAESTRLVPLGARIAIYDLEEREASPPTPTEPGRVVELARNTGAESSLASGLILGRSADGDGFLVESPRPDGHRWIGKVDWETGELELLVGGVGQHAFASMTRDGGMVYSSRREPGDPWVLVYRARADDPDSERVVSRQGSWVYPMVSDGYVLAFDVGREQGRAAVFALDGPDGMIQDIGRVGFETTMGAYQAAQGAPTPIGEPWRNKSHFRFLSPHEGGVVETFAAEGGVQRIGSGSIRCVHLDMGGETPYVCGTSEEVRAVGIRGGVSNDRDYRFEQALSLLDRPGVPFLLTGDSGGFLVVTPRVGGGSTTWLEVLRIGITLPESRR